MDKDSGFTDADFNNYFKIRKTVMKMLEDRGYYISLEEKDKRLEDWKSTHRKDNLICILASKIENKDEYIYVESSNFVKLGVQEVTDFAKKLHSEGVRNGIVILKGSITALAKQVKLSLK